MRGGWPNWYFLIAMRDRPDWKLRLRRRLIAFLEVSPYARLDFAACAEDAYIDADVFISDPACVRLGSRAVIYRGTRIFCGPGTFSMADGSHLAGQVYVNAIQGSIELGRGVAVGPMSVIVSYSNHYAAGKTIAESRRVGDVRIGDDVFIGAGTVILPGVHIGNGAVVGAGAVVTHDVEEYRIVAGNPAHAIKSRER